MERQPLWEAVLRRIGFLLGTNEPKETLKEIVLSKIPPKEQNDTTIYITADRLIRQLIIYYQDPILLELWAEFTKGDFLQELKVNQKGGHDENTTNSSHSRFFRH